MPRGAGSDVVAALHADKGIASANVINGRGISERKKYFAEEVDILMVMVNQSRADEIFDYLHEHAEVGTSRGRLMFQQALGTSSSFILPDVEPEEKVDTEKES